MRIELRTASVFTDSGQFLKTLNCPLRTSWSVMTPGEHGSQICDSCSHEVHDTSTMSDDELLLLLSRDPSAYLILMAVVSIGTAGDPTPVVIPAVITGSGFTTSKFADGYVTRPASGDSYVVSRFGDGWDYTRPQRQIMGNLNLWQWGDYARHWRIDTSKFGNGYISRSSGGTASFRRTTLRGHFGEQDNVHSDFQRIFLEPLFKLAAAESSDPVDELDCVRGQGDSANGFF